MVGPGPFPPGFVSPSLMGTSLIHPRVSPWCQNLAFPLCSLQPKMSGKHKRVVKTPGIIVICFKDQINAENSSQTWGLLVPTTCCRACKKLEIGATSVPELSWHWWPPEHTGAAAGPSSCQGTRRSDLAAEKCRGAGTPSTPPQALERGSAPLFPCF